MATTDLDHLHPVYPSEPAADRRHRLNQAWVADITYIRILTGFLYLAAHPDATAQGGGLLSSRRIDTALVFWLPSGCALVSRLSHRCAAAVCITRPGGVQYCSANHGGADLGRVCDQHVPHGNPYDNAHMSRS